MVVSTVLFVDLDGTICVNPFRTAVFPHITSLLSPRTGLSGDQLIELFVQEFQTRIIQSNGHTPSAVNWDEIVMTVSQRLGVTDLNVSVLNLVSDHAHAPYIRILDESDVALRRLRQDKHRRLVVASMGLAIYQMPVLKGLGLAPLFHDFLMPDLVGHLKNTPEYYDKWVRKAPDALFINVGDTYRDDIRIPKEFGFRAIMKVPIPELNALDPLERPAVLQDYRNRIPGFPENPPLLPDAVITHISELPEVVERLEELVLPLRSQIATVPSTVR